MEKISIIVPVYNVENYLRKCLDSILNQTYKNIEIILIDDGSKDNSLEKIKKYPDVKLITTDRLQAGGARNAGMKLATGEYIVF